MKLKSLLFGSAAVLAAGSGALAADLPMVEPVNYVRICDAFGAKFYYIPGTDTCLRVGGYVRVQSGYVFGDDLDLARRYNDAAHDVNRYTTQARGHILLDARTQADIGLVRAYVALQMTVGGRNTTADGARAAGVDSYGTSAGLAAAYVQVSNDWGTYTAGFTGSFFDFYGGMGWGFRLGEEAGTGEATLFAWTFAGGNGFSMTLSAEDPDSIGRRRDGDATYEGLEAPDGVANVRIDQGWGSAQLMGAIRHIHEDPGDDGIGFAVGGGLSLNLPGGWVFSSQAGYSEGAVSYISSDIGSFGDIDGPTADDTNESWAARGGLKGPLAANWTGWIGASYIHVEEHDNTEEYDFLAVLAGASWEPVSGLIMGPEVAYNSYDGTDGAGAVDDYDLWSIMWRVQRSF